jgi:hypothetical protein
MFQNSEGSVDKGRTWMIMAAAAVVVVIAAVAIVMWSSRPSSPSDQPAPKKGLPNAKHAGDPEFDQEKGLVSLVNKKFFTQANMLGQTQAVATGDVMNFTRKTVVGVELRGNVIGKDGQVKATVLAIPVPKVHAQIAPGKSIPYTVTIDGAPPPSEIDDITLEVEGLVFGESAGGEAASGG